MGVHIKVFGGKSVKKVVQHYFRDSKHAADYLIEFGVPPDTTGRCFSYKYNEFTLSHPCEDVLSRPNLPDNDAARSALQMMQTDNRMNIHNGQATGTSKAVPQGETRTEAAARESLEKTRDMLDTTRTKAERIADGKAKLAARAAGKTTELSAEPKSNVEVVSGGKTISLKEICRDIDMEPRAARAKLRRLFKGNDKQRWEWSPAEAAKVKAELTK